MKENTFNALVSCIRNGFESLVIPDDLTDGQLETLLHVTTNNSQVIEISLFALTDNIKYFISHKCNGLRVLWIRQSAGSFEQAAEFVKIIKPTALIISPELTNEEALQHYNEYRHNVGDNADSFIFYYHSGHRLSNYMPHEVLLWQPLLEEYSSLFDGLSLCSLNEHYIDELNKLLEKNILHNYQLTLPSIVFKYTPEIYGSEDKMNLFMHNLVNPYTALKGIEVFELNLVDEYKGILVKLIQTEAKTLSLNTSHLLQTKDAHIKFANDLTEVLQSYKGHSKKLYLQLGNGEAAVLDSEAIIFNKVLECFKAQYNTNIRELSISVFYDEPFGHDIINLHKQSFKAKLESESLKLKHLDISLIHFKRHDNINEYITYSLEEAIEMIKLINNKHHSTLSLGLEFSSYKEADVEQLLSFVNSSEFRLTELKLCESKERLDFRNYLVQTGPTPLEQLIYTNIQQNKSLTYFNKQLMPKYYFLKDTAKFIAEKGYLTPEKYNSVEYHSNFRKYFKFKTSVKAILEKEYENVDLKDFKTYLAKEYFYASEIFNPSSDPQNKENYNNTHLNLKPILEHNSDEPFFTMPIEIRALIGRYLISDETTLAKKQITNVSIEELGIIGHNEVEVE